MNKKDEKATTMKKDVKKEAKKDCQSKSCKATSADQKASQK